MSASRDVAAGVVRRASPNPTLARALRGPKSVHAAVRVYRHAASLATDAARAPQRASDANALEAYFGANSELPGIYEWRHDFETPQRGADWQPFW